MTQSNIKIDENIENESCSTTVFEPHIEPKNSPIGPPKVKTTPKLSQNQISELKETKKMKIIAQFIPDPNAQNSLFFAPKSKEKIAL